MGKLQRLSYEELMDLKTAIWDIESGGLDANFDPILCASVKRFGRGKVETFRMDEVERDGPWDDSELCAQIAFVLEDFDVIVHHYGDKFDLPFLNTRLLKHENQLLDTSEMKIIDTWWTMRYKYKFARNTLAAGAEFLGCRNKKTPLSGDTWLKAKCGDRGAMNYVVKHNIADVRVLEELVRKLAEAASLRFKYWR